MWGWQDAIRRYQGAPYPKWIKADKDLRASYLHTKDDVHAALCDSVDTVSLFTYSFSLFSYLSLPLLFRLY